MAESNEFRLCREVKAVEYEMWARAVGIRDACDVLRNPVYICDSRFIHGDDGRRSPENLGMETELQRIMRD